MGDGEFQHFESVVTEVIIFDSVSQELFWGAFPKNYGR